MSIDDNINNLKKFYKGLATVLEDCNQTIDGFLALHENEINFHTNLKLKLKQNALQQEAEQTEELKRDNKKTPTENMIYIEDYFKNNAEKLNGKTLYSPPNDLDYTVFTLKNEDNEYYLIYNTRDKKLYWANNTTETTKKAVLLSLLLPRSNDDLHNLLNVSYLHILSSQQEHETHSIPPDVIGELSFVTKINKRLANELIIYTPPSQGGGGKKTTYKLNGEKVVLLHKNKKVQRSIYVKGNGKTKYCIIDKEYVLLSKDKNKIQ